jgi:3-hydroxyacyl-CoA dehydrogenase
MNPTKIGPFQNIVVIGAGLIGTQFTAELLAAGMKVTLLDMKADGPNPDKRVEENWDKLLKMKSPPTIRSERLGAKVYLGNSTDDLDVLKEADFILEAIPEKLEWKQVLYSTLAGYEESFEKNGTLIGTVTSGFPRKKLLEGLPPSFAERVLLVHPFNPVRWMPLVEIDGYDESALERVKWNLETYLNKKVLRVKDTPCFIGNRIGMFNLMQNVHPFVSGEFSVGEIDLMRGEIAGCPKSAIFRTMDVVGLDTVKGNADNLYKNLPENDPYHEHFELPQFILDLIARGSLGAKVKAGIYKKVGKDILSVNLKTLEYEHQPKVNLPGYNEISEIPDLAERLRRLYVVEGRMGDYFRKMYQELWAYCANRIPEIADTPEQIDNAMKWGYGWKMGPFEIWNAIGFEKVAQDIVSAGYELPDWVLEKIATGGSLFEQASDAPAPDTRVEMPSAELSPVVKPPQGLAGIFYRLLSLFARGKFDGKPKAALKPLRIIPDQPILLADVVADPNRVLRSYPGGGILYDIGDDVAMFSFTSKANSIGTNVAQALIDAVAFVEAGNFKGMVIANGGEHFSTGANLKEVAPVLLDPTGTVGKPVLKGFVVDFQKMIIAIATSRKPIVAYVHGLFLGGGVELVRRCQGQVLHMDAIGGLVEAGVGLLPAGTGSTFMAQTAAQRAATLAVSDVWPHLSKLHEYIATAKLSAGALEAVEMGIVPDTARIISNPDLGILCAKEEVLALAVNFVPAPSLGEVFVLGPQYRAALQHRAYVFRKLGQATEHDELIANKVAYIMTGGDLVDEPGYVSAIELLALEVEGFIDLAFTEKSKARIFAKKKPLRN